jgi:hypothetical protein
VPQSAGSLSATARRLVLVVGKGRSGTSLLAGILGRLGFHVPQPEVKADRTNPQGFSEPLWVVRFHKRLLHARRVTAFDARSGAWEQMAELANDGDVLDELGSWLDAQFTEADNLVVKDPRIVWFLPLWLRCAGDLDVQTSFVTMIRHPAEVVASGRESYGTWQNDASRALSWLNVTLHAEHATRGARRAFVPYDDLLENWAREVSRCGKLLDVSLLAGIDRADHPDVDAFVDPTLHRSAVGWDGVRLPAALQARCVDVWNQTARLAEPGGDDEVARSRLDAARLALTDLDMTASTGLPLVVRIMLFVPPRYRAWLPLPVVHAARRIVRSRVRSS